MAKRGQFDFGTREEAELELKRLFGYHAPDADRKGRHEEVRGSIHLAASQIIELVPSSRERDTALERLQEAMFWANAAIARDGK